MSATKKYFWFKMKTDFFENISIKILKKQKRGDQLVILFMKVILYSLKTDGYLYYKHMMPTFHEELALAIGEKPSIIKDLITYLINFEELEMIDENTYFIKLIEDCVGSDSKKSTSKKDRIKNINDESFQKNEIKCSTEIEKETDIYTEKSRLEKTTSAFSAEKKSGSGNAKNKISEKIQTSPQHNSTAQPKPPRNYEMEEYLRQKGKDPLRFYDKDYGELQD